MKILYLSYDGLTDALGQSQILAYQKQIASQETQVWILSFEKPAIYAKLRGRVEQVCNESGIHWHPLFYTKNPPVFSTLWDIRKAWHVIKDLQKLHLFDIVHCRGYIPALLGARMKKAFGTRFIFDMRGWWPDEKKESGAWASPLYAPVYRFFKKKEREFFQYSDITVSLTEAGKKEIIKQGWKDAEKVWTVPTCTDLSLFQPLSEENKIKKKMSIGLPPYSKVLVYSGALGGNYPLADIFLFINTFLSLSDSHHCLILSKDQQLGNFALPERTFIRSVNYSEVGEHLAICDFGMIYYKPAFSNIGRCPTKLGEYWACGLPVVCPPNVGDVDDLFTKYPQTGYTVPWKLDNIKALLSNLPYISERQYLQNAAMDYFSLQKGIGFYKNLYKELLK